MLISSSVISFPDVGASTPLLRNGAIPGSRPLNPIYESSRLEYVSPNGQYCVPQLRDGITGWLIRVFHRLPESRVPTHKSLQLPLAFALTVVGQRYLHFFMLLKIRLKKYIKFLLVFIYFFGIWYFK